MTREEAINALIEAAMEEAIDYADGGDGVFVVDEAGKKRARSLVKSAKDTLTDRYADIVGEFVQALMNVEA